MSEEERWFCDLNDLLPVEASVGSRDHWVPNSPLVPSNVQSEEIVPASKSSSYPAKVSET